MTSSKYEQHYNTIHTVHRRTKRKLLLVKVQSERVSFQSTLESRDHLHLFQINTVQSYNL